ncbi:uncharacterized protein LOC132304926 [Cornus florida]|uniref:uncharacterized protein LOC132304926 n=1 Tax=Cornus florida TaxID=4283 RepID=UPI0028A207BC|nr:uncharacterized protein LOC132304926 [Cornus florida]
MGCGISRMDDSELVSLCRERKKLIKAAVDCRYALASAHISYFQSLLDVGNALNHFVEEELLISVDSVDTLSTADSDHQSLGEGSHLELLSSNSDDTDVISLTDDVHEGSRVYGNSAPQNESSRGVNSNVYSMKRSSEEVPTRFFEQPQAVPTTLQWQDSSKLLGQYSEYGNRAFFCDPMNIPANNLRFSQYENRAALDGPISLPPNNVRFSRYENGASYDGVMNLPPDITQYRNEVSIGGPMNLPPDNLGFYRYGYGADLPNINHRFPLNKNGLSGVSMYSSYDGPYYNQTYIPPTAPWVPPPPEASNWDYLNPFSVVDDTYTRYYSQGGHGIGFGSTDPDLGEVRMREGIPDLEDDTKQNLMEEKPNDIISRINEPNDIGLNTKTRGVSGEGSSEVASPKNDGQVPLAQGKETRTNQDNPVADINVIKTTSDTIEEDTRRESDTVVPKGLEEEEKKNSGTFQVQKSIEEGEFLEQVNSTTLSSHGLRELKEVLKEIKDAFEAAFNYGKEVSVILEAGKLPYQPRGTIFKGRNSVNIIFIFQHKPFSSWIPRLVAPNMVTSSHPKHTILKRSAYRTVKVAKVYNANLEKDICIKSSNLSSTLEKMYAWEKKLYEEVKYNPAEHLLVGTWNCTCSFTLLLKDWAFVNALYECKFAMRAKCLYNFYIDFRIFFSLSGIVAEFQFMGTKGYTQTYGIDYDETFSLVAKISSIRALMSIVANCNWPLFQLDVKNAFLHGDLVEEVYMEKPPGFVAQGEYRHTVCCLKKVLYGLKQSP